MRKYIGVLVMALLTTSVLAAGAPHRVLAQNGNGVLASLPGGMAVADAQNAQLVQLEAIERMEAIERKRKQAALEAIEFPIAVIKVRYVKPSLLLWWINPLDQPEPEEVRRSRELRGSSGERDIPGLADSLKKAVIADMSFDEFRRTFRSAPPPYKEPLPKPGQTLLPACVLPPGIDGLAAVDGRNEIWAHGTEDGVQYLRLLVEYLDKPMRQIEIEAQFIEVGATDAARLLVEPVVKPNTARGGLSVRTVWPNFQNELRMLLAAKSANLVNSPRLTTFDNMTAAVQALTTYFFSIGDPNAPRPKDGWSLLGIKTGVRLTCTPTINRDGTVTLAMGPFLPVEMSLVQGGDAKEKSTAFSPYQSKTSMQTIVNIKDGGTIAISGLERKMVNIGGAKIAVPADFAVPKAGANAEAKERTTSKPERELLVFVTVRVVGRVDANSAGS